MRITAINFLLFYFFTFLLFYIFLKNAAKLHFFFETAHIKIVKVSQTAQIAQIFMSENEFLPFLNTDCTDIFLGNEFS